MTATGMQDGKGRGLSQLGALMLAALLWAIPAAGQGQAGPEALVEAMRNGGTVIFLRHAATDESQIDTGRLNDRAGQRNLSPAGRAQARSIGRAFDALDIPLARILSSPVYRSRDTAELAFGPDRIEVTMDLVADDYAGPELRRMLTATERLLATPPPAGGNILLIGHRTPLEMVTGRRFPDSTLPEGAMAVFRPTGDGTELLGALPADALIEAAEDAE